MAGKKRKKRDSTINSREVLYGYHPVVEALIANRRTVYHLAIDRTHPSDRQAGIIALAQERGISWQSQAPEQIRAVCGSEQHQGIAASVSALPEDRLTTVVSGCSDHAGGCLIVLLDGIVDPNNLGAIVRTAHCAGADALVIPRDRAVGPTPTVSKISAGALEHTRICRVTNLSDTIGWLKQQGIWVAGLAMEAEQTVFQADLKGPLALAVGGEEKGLRRLVKATCDYLVSIPMRGRVDSLNASTAAAVVLYEALRQRQGSAEASVSVTEGRYFAKRRHDS